MARRYTTGAAIWCGGGTALVALLHDGFGKDSVFVRSPHHIQVRHKAKVHNIWIDSAGVVKYKLADQAGRAEIAKSSRGLFEAIQGHEDAKSDLTEMRRALELSELIDSAKAALAGLSHGIFVDAGIKDGQAQIGVVRVSFETDGEHVRAESRPVFAANSTEAEQTAIEYAIGWADPDEVIFCDNQVAVRRVSKTHGNRIRWLPRQHNKAADRLANLRTKGRRRRGKRKKKAKPQPR
jgi:ribonuclease HI